MTLPPYNTNDIEPLMSKLDAYKGIDHTALFVRVFVTCPYSEERANQSADVANKISGLHDYRFQIPLYSDKAYPVIIEASKIVLEADRTIGSCDAFIWYIQKMARNARDAQVSDIWWSMRLLILGHPHGSCSSLFVNQHVGRHMHKILEVPNNIGIYGPIKEYSLDMLSEKKRKLTGVTLI